MSLPFILASASEIRAYILRAAGLDIVVRPARVDEDMLKAALRAEMAPPNDIADALAEAKARKIAEKTPSALVLGCDQILALGADIFAKPVTPDDAFAQLCHLRGQTHHLYSAAVLYENARPIWRHVGHARLTMRDMSDAALNTYVQRNWHSIQHAVGAYKIEEEGVQLFSAIDGDSFTIQGIPLIPLLNYLVIKGVIAT